MTLYIIGLGLGDEKDITVKGLEIIKRADKVYLEEYRLEAMDGLTARDLFRRGFEQNKGAISVLQGRVKPV